MSLKTHLTGAMVAALLTACASVEQNAPPVVFATLPPMGTPVLTTSTDIAASPSATFEVADSTPDSTAPAATGDESTVTAAAISALANELGVDESQVSFVSIIPTEWNDLSLGCPQPGEANLQVITPGYNVTLSVSGMSYEVHTDSVGTAVVCNVPIESELDPIVTEFIATAKQELMRDLAVSEDQVAVVRSEAFDWSDASLGCADPGQSYNQVVTPGYRIILAVDVDRYEFHTDYQRMIRCDNPTE